MLIGQARERGDACEARRLEEGKSSRQVREGLPPPAARSPQRCSPCVPPVRDRDVAHCTFTRRQGSNLFTTFCLAEVGRAGTCVRRACTLPIVGCWELPTLFRCHRHQLVTNT